jgi:hypothetical protein
VEEIKNAFSSAGLKILSIKKNKTPLEICFRFDYGVKFFVAESGHFRVECGDSPEGQVIRHLVLAAIKGLRRHAPQKYPPSAEQTRSYFYRPRSFNMGYWHV